jgi:hypothetical protein
VEKEFHGIQRRSKTAIIIIGGLLAFMVLWRVLAITVSDIASLLRH